MNTNCPNCRCTLSDKLPAVERYSVMVYDIRGRPCALAHTQVCVDCDLEQRAAARRLRAALISRGTLVPEGERWITHWPDGRPWPTLRLMAPSRVAA